MLEILREIEMIDLIIGNFISILLCAIIFTVFFMLIRNFDKYKPIKLNKNIFENLKISFLFSVTLSPYFYLSTYYIGGTLTGILFFILFFRFEGLICDKHYELVVNSNE